MSKDYTKIEAKSGQNHFESTLCIRMPKFDSGDRMIRFAGRRGLKSNPDTLPAYPIESLHRSIRRETSRIWKIIGMRFGKMIPKTIKSKYWEVYIKYFGWNAKKDLTIESSYVRLEPCGQGFQIDKSTSLKIRLSEGRQRQWGIGTWVQSHKRPKQN